MIDERIHTGETLSVPLFGEHRNARDYLLGFYDQAQIPPLDHVVATAPPLVAEVHHGVWVARCPCGARGNPAPGCPVFLGSMLAWCIRCGNQQVGHGWRPVVVPTADERARIEAVLLCRPKLEDRNWTPGETVAELMRQNLEHGDPVPGPDVPTAAAPVPVPTGPRWPSDAARAILNAAKQRRWRRW